jgi:hypothetical protein
MNKTRYESSHCAIFCALLLKTIIPFLGGPPMVAQWLRYCAENQKVAGSIPDGVIGIFH